MDQKLQYLLNISFKDALRFYLDAVQPYATTYQRAVPMIDREYNSNVCQNRIKNYLNSLRVREFEGTLFDVSSCFSKVYQLILKFSRHVPQSHRGDSHRVGFLRKAVLSYGWGHEPLSRVATHFLSFQQLYGELETSLQQNKNARLESIRDNDPNSQALAEENPFEVQYVLEGRYMSPSKSYCTIHASPPNSLEIGGSCNCEEPSHMAKDCPKHCNLAKATARKLEYYQKKDSKFCAFGSSPFMPSNRIRLKHSLPWQRRFI